MDNRLLLKHKRFEKAKLENPKTKYFAFFNDYAKRKYTTIEIDCLCGSKNDQIVSKFDRYSVEFKTVICKECGLIRSAKYFTDHDINDFYKYHYRNVMSNEANYLSAKAFFKKQKEYGIEKYKLIKEKSNIKLEGLKILDLGGGAGGCLDNFKDSNDVFLVDFFEPYLDIARKNNIKVLKGGLKEVTFKPDIIIISHVLEHWSDFEEEIKNLIKIQKVNQTINYIEFPGVDSLKLGRRNGDFLQDIHIPHVWYFTSYVFENLMNRHGFEKLHINSEIKSLFIYTGVKKKCKNYYNEVKDDLVKAETRIKIQTAKKIIKFFIPKAILDFRLDIIKKKKN